MNKILMISCGVLMMSSVAMADETATETCANGAGTVITGISGNKYCRSNQRMSWLNAHAWCDGLKKRLFDLSDCKCSDMTANCAGSICAELRLGIALQIWTARPSKTGTAYHVVLDRGNIYTGDRTHTNSYSYAVCHDL